MKSRAKSQPSVPAKLAARHAASVTAAVKPAAAKLPTKNVAGKVTAKAVPVRVKAPTGATKKLNTSSPKRAAARNFEAPPAAVKKKTATKAKTRLIRSAKFSVGQVVRHRVYPFRGIVFDIDPVFANTDEWLNAIPADVRPRRNQPFYHLLAESAETEYIAYVSEQNLLADDSGLPMRHPQINDYFVENDDGTLRALLFQAH